MKKAFSFVVALALSLPFAGGVLAAPRNSAGSAPRAAAANPPAAPIPPAIAGLLAAYPQGGDGLTNAVINAIVENPANASAIVLVGNGGNPDQMAAIAAGLVRAVEVLKASNPQAVALVRKARLLANQQFAQIIASISAQSYADGYGVFGGGFSSGGGGFSSGGGGGAIPLATPN